MEKNIAEIFCSVPCCGLGLIGTGLIYIFWRAGFRRRLTAFMTYHAGAPLTVKHAESLNQISKMTGESVGPYDHNYGKN